jgi:hypothetical protein
MKGDHTMANVSKEVFDKTIGYMMRKIAEQQVRIDKLAEACGMVEVKNGEGGPDVNPKA